MINERPMNRRDFLKHSAALASAGMALNIGLSPRSYAANQSLIELTATQAVAAMRKGEISAEAYATALLDRAAATKSLNAFINLDREATLAAARKADKQRTSGATLGALHGLPIPVKDAVNTKDFATTAGTGALLGFRPMTNAPVVESLLSAGGILMGKTNMHELSYGWTSNNKITGATHNPYDPTRIPGGSSGGSGAAVAALVAPMAVAEDTFGSIRVPAMMCGVCGLRPSFERYSNAGIMPIAPKFFDTPGPLARSVADLALFDSVMTGNNAPLQEKSLQGARIGIAPDYFLAGLDPEVQRVMDQTIAKLQEAGAVLVWANLPGPVNNSMGHGFSVMSRDTVPSIKTFLEEHKTGVSFDQLLQKMSPEMRGLFEAFALPGGAMYATAQSYQSAVEQLGVIRQSMRDYFRNQQVAAIAFPPVMVPATPIGQEAEVEIAGKKVPLSVVMARNIAVGSCASLPGLVLPAGQTSNGLPVGIEFDAAQGSDRDLLALGLALEKVLGPMPVPKL